MTFPPIVEKPCGKRVDKMLNASGKDVGRKLVFHSQFLFLFKPVEKCG